MVNNLKALRNVGVLIGFGVVLQGCGNPHTDSNIDPFGEYEDPASKREREAREKKFAQRPIIQYMFNNTFSAVFPSVGQCGAGAYYSGKLSPEFKTTMVQLLHNLSIAGFQGYNADYLEKTYSSRDNYTCPYTRTVNQPQKESDLVNNVVDHLINVGGGYPFQYVEYLYSLNYVSTLIGLTYEDRALILVKEEKNPKLVLANAFRSASETNLPYIDTETDVLVTDAQIAAWNKIFIDTLKEDPFFGANPAYIKDLSSQMALNPLDEPSVDSTALNINGVVGVKQDLTLPLNVNLKGHLNTNSSNQFLLGKVNFVGNRFNIGTVHAYEKTGLNAQNEHSISFGYNKSSLIIEGQVGAVCKLNKNSNAETTCMGQRYQAIMGYSFCSLTPFVQAVHQNIQQFANTTTYLGLDIAHTHRVNNTAALTVHMTAKLGMQSLDAFTFHQSSLDVSVNFSPATDVWFATSLAINPLDVMLNMNLNVSY